MSFDLCLSRYVKGAVKEYSNFHEKPEDIRELGEGIVQSSRSLVCLWFSKNLESVKTYNQLYNDARWTGPHESIMYLVKKTEYFSLLNDLKEALTKKDEVAKAVDEAVGDRTVYGRSDINGREAYVSATEIIKKHIPERLRMSMSDVMDWHISCLRDFFWVFWDQIEKTIDRLEELNKNMDWDTEDLFFFVC